MVSKEQIEEAIMPQVNQVLLVAEAALPEGQFRAFRKVVLDCFGKSGLGKELERLFEGETVKEGKARAGTDYAREGVHHG